MWCLRGTLDGSSSSVWSVWRLHGITSSKKITTKKFKISEPCVILSEKTIELIRPACHSLSSSSLLSLPPLFFLVVSFSSESMNTTAVSCPVIAYGRDHVVDTIMMVLIRVVVSFTGNAEPSHRWVCGTKPHLTRSMKQVYPYRAPSHQPRPRHDPRTPLHPHHKGPLLAVSTPRAIRWASPFLRSINTGVNRGTGEADWGGGGVDQGVEEEGMLMEDDDTDWPPGATW